jgi:hypothetical protein
VQFFIYIFSFSSVSALDMRTCADTINELQAQLYFRDASIVESTPRIAAAGISRHDDQHAAVMGG